MMVKRRKANSKGKKRTKSSKFAKAIGVLRGLKGSQRYSAIRNANDKFIRDIVSHVKKLRSRKLSSKLQKIVKQHSAKLRLITNPRVSLKRKRTALSQKGGLLPALLPLLAPLAAPLVKPVVDLITGR